MVKNIEYDNIRMVFSNISEFYQIFIFSLNPQLYLNMINFYYIKLILNIFLIILFANPRIKDYFDLYCLCLEFQYI